MKAKNTIQTHGFYGMIGTSPLMTDLFRYLRLVSETDYPVLIRGETGTGKEMAVRALHSLSERASEPMVIINCSTIPENLLESELFGHEKGAFTGAEKQKKGKFELADKGTVFLDEIGEMPQSLQVKLLRFLQEGTVERLGGTQTLHLDVRVIGATNMNLEQAVREKKFREDFFFRLNVVPINIPPLRDRQEDILLLANHFIREEKEKLKRHDISLSSAAIAVLTAHLWPGNIRELKNCICRAIVKANYGIIRPSDLGLNNAEIQVTSRPLNFSIKVARDEAEYRIITQAMSVTYNNISQAAKLLGVSRSGLHDLLKKHGMNGNPVSGCQNISSNLSMI